jgi:hypothetical protein
LLDEALTELLGAFGAYGHDLAGEPDDATDVLLTTARFNENVGWRQAPLFTARRRYGIRRTPTVVTLVHATRADFERVLDHFEAVLAKDSYTPDDLPFEGLAPAAGHVLVEQGRRGGPILSLERLVQVHAKSIRNVLLVGDRRPEAAYHFDLVGAHPRTDAGPAFYDDIVLRIVTSVCAHEVTDHEVEGPAVPAAVWRDLVSPGAMRAAARELGRRGFFTEMIRIAELTQVPAVSDAVASQYSEGCFATWEPGLDALVATVTGSARPVDKAALSDDDLAVLTGVRPDGRGALVRPVQGSANVAPSSESVEMCAVDDVLPRVVIGTGRGEVEVPVARSKLHGHRGVRAYDPEHVEYVPLDPPYYHYLVSCATGAQAEGIVAAFGRSEALRDPADPRQVAFTVLPGHGVVILEKWVPGKAPFQAVWEHMDAGWLEVDPWVPQGTMRYVEDEGGRRRVDADQPPVRPLRRPR